MSTNLENSLFSQFKSATDNGLLRDGSQDRDRLADITFKEFIECIKTGRNPLWKYRAELAREAIGDKKRYDEVKKHSPGVTIWGTFAIRRAENAEVASGLMAIDLDKLGDMLPMVFNALKENPYVVAVFRSIGGNGLCVIHRVNPDKWAESFEGLEAYYAENYRIVVSFDKSVKDISRLRFVSYDPECYVNYKAQLFRQYPKKQTKVEKPKAYPRTDDDIQYVIDQINERKLDITQGDGKWVKIGLALINKYGESGRDYFHQICQYHPEYDKDEADKKYDYWSNCANGSVTIASFYYLAKQAGIDTMTRQTKELIRVASGQKRNGTTFESALRAVIDMTSYSLAEAEPIIKQVYESKEEIDTEETIYQQADTLLKSKGLRFNEVRRRFVNSDGVELDERGLNNLYIEFLNVFDGKIKRPDFDTLLKSDAVPMFNPLRNFFLSYRNRKTHGAIQELAATLETDTGYDDAGNFDPHYVAYFIRKWLIGLVANVFNDNNVCALMPVLTGKQGSGKTEWFRRLLPDELQVYYAECKFEEGKDDEILMTQKLILMNDELEGLTVQDARKLKALTSKRVITAREPYGRVSVDLVRLAVLCGTSNPREVISDPTGNRRVIPINVLSINHAAYNDIDKIDVLMEAYHAWKAGERHTLTREDIQRLQDSTGGFQRHSIERQLLMQYFAKPTGKGGETVEFMSGVQIMVYLETRANNRRLSEHKITLELGAMGFEKLQKRHNGERTRMYEVIRLE